MPSAYPTTVRSWRTKLNVTDIVDASHVNDLQDEVRSIQNFVGTTSPSGSFPHATVKDWLASLEANKVGPVHTHTHTSTTDKTVGDDHTQYTLHSQGTFATRPLFGRVGRTYFATDRKTLYYDSGDAWNEAGGSGGGGWNRHFLLMGT